MQFLQLNFLFYYKFLIVEVAYVDSMILITTMLFIVSIIPSIAITEIGVRGSVALFLFGLVSSNTIGILSSAFVMWVINLLLPAMLGTIFIFTLKFLDNNAIYKINCFVNFSFICIINL